MSRSAMVALISVALGAAVFAPIAMAQMHGAGMSLRGARAPAGFGHNAGVGFAGRSHLHSFGAIFLGDPFYADYPVAPLTIPPQFVVAQPAAIAVAPPETKSEPLMIELQGNRYVRFGGRQQLAEPGSNAAPDYAEAQALSNAQVPQPRAHAGLPTVLIFRDGHREQVPEYAIVGSTLYANGDYWESGYWTKNIQLSALNIPATMKANHDNGVNFTLPSAPNEVVTRP
jgi:hypothetical protein